MLLHGCGNSSTPLTPEGSALPVCPVASIVCSQSKVWEGLLWGPAQLSFFSRWGSILCVHGQTGNLKLSRRGRGSLMVYVQQHRTHSTQSSLWALQSPSHCALSAGWWSSSVFTISALSLGPHFLWIWQSYLQALQPFFCSLLSLEGRAPCKYTVASHYLGAFSGKRSLQVVL